VADAAVLDLLREPSLPSLLELQVGLMDVLDGVTLAQLMALAEARAGRVARAYV
jgi:hypothetical protein